MLPVLMEMKLEVEVFCCRPFPQAEPYVGTERSSSPALPTNCE